MKNQNKKGFTIVELVIVIAVIAILAAVLIPTFVGLVDKANRSADQQAVNQMNKALAMNDALEGTDNILDVFEALEEAGMSAKNYKPLAKDMYFFYDAELKKVLYVDKTMKVVAPEEHKDLTNTGRTWLSLTQTIETKAPADTDYTDGVTVKSGAEMLYIIDEIEAGRITNAAITIPAEGIDMMGASFGITEVKTDITISGEGDTPAVIKNATSVDTGFYGDGVTPGHDGQYFVSLFGSLVNGKKLTIENVVFENVHVKNTHTSGVGILVSNIEQNSTLTLKNVTIKNSSVVGHRNTGAIAGYINTTCDAIVVEGTLALENVDVKTVGGRSGLLIGCTSNTTIATYDSLKSLKTASITVDADCSYTLYDCEQNTGDGLGLQADGITVKSWYYDGENKRIDKEYNFVEKALVMKGDEAKNDLINTIVGWND